MNLPNACPSPAIRDTTVSSGSWSRDTWPVAGTPLRLIVVEDESLFRDLLITGLVARVPDAQVVAQFSTAEQAMDESDGVEADVLLTDIDLGDGMDGMKLGIAMRRRRRVRGVTLLSNLAMPGLLTEIPLEVRGGWSYLLKTSVADLQQLALAIRGCAAGDVVVDSALTAALVPSQGSPLSALTPRQLEVLSLMANGWSNKRIAEELHVSVRTVESAVSDILSALGIAGGAADINARVACVLVYLRHTVTQAGRAHGH